MTCFWFSMLNKSLGMCKENMPEKKTEEKNYDGIKKKKVIFASVISRPFN